MSSMRNAVTRRPHKERAQPKAREKWGLLEKRKDYTLRAKDYNLKKAKLATLSEKARNKNEDEFAFGMYSATKARTGQHGQGDTSKVLSHDSVKLMKTQDAGYLRVSAGRGRKELQKLTEEAGLDAPATGRKVVFVDEDEKMEVDGLLEEQSSTAQAENEDDTTETSSAPPLRQSKKKIAAHKRTLHDLKIARKRRKRAAEMRSEKLEMLKKRQVQIMAAAGELELQRAKMARAVGGVNKEGVKWRIRERKR